MRTRWVLGIITAVAGIVALTHQSLTAALASAHRDSALKAAHAMLTWPLPMTQPILAGIGAFVLLGLAVQTNGWRQAYRAAEAGSCWASPLPPSSGPRPWRFSAC